MFKSKSRDFRFFILIACFATSKLTALISLFQLQFVVSLNYWTLRVKAWKNHGHWEMFRTVTMQLNFLIDYEWSGIREIVFLSNFDSKLTSSDVLWEEKFAIISQYAIVWLFFWLWNMAGYLASGFPYSCFFRLDGFQRVMVWWHDAMMVNLASYTQPWAFQQEGCQPDTSLGQQIQRYFWTAHHW